MSAAANLQKLKAIIMEKKLIFNLQLFADPHTQTTEKNTPGVNDLSSTMKTFYKTSLLENARNEHYYAQFGQKQPLPKNEGKKIEWRKFDTFEKALTPLTEGVTPDGRNINMSKIEAEIQQYGDYTTVSDRLELEAVDPIITLTTEEHGAQAGDTIDTLTRNVVMAGSNVIYGGSGVTSRSALAKTDTLTPTLIDKAMTFLKKMKAPTINGDYVAIIHPSVAFDLRESQGWEDVHKYAQPAEIYNGEIGKLHGVRFVESTEATIYKGAPLTAAAANLTVKTNGSSATIAVKEAISQDEAAALVGRKILIGTTANEILSASYAAAGSATITVKTAGAVTADTVIYPGEAGAGNTAVYGTIFMGKDAYGIVEPSAESLEVIVKQRGSAGTADPLDQRSTIGWKASHAAKILYQERLVRVETGSSYGDVDEAN